MVSCSTSSSSIASTGSSLTSSSPEEVSNSFLKLVDRVLETGRRVVAELLGLGERVDELLVLAAQVVEQLALEAADVLDRHVVELAGGAGPDRDDLVLDGVRRVLRLLEQLDQAGAALQLGLRRRVQVGAEGGERLQLAVLGEVEPQPAGDLASCP